MIGNLDEALRTLLVSSLPALLGGNAPPVTLGIVEDIFLLDSASAEAPTSEARPDDQVDNFPFNPINPPPNFTLSKPPYPGPRRVRLTTSDGDRISLQSTEILWDAVDSQKFSLALRPIHDMSHVTGIQVLYSVTAVFTTLKANQNFLINLQSANAAQLEQAEALSLGVIELNHQDLIDGAATTYDSGGYSAAVTVKSFKLLQGITPASGQRQFTFTAEVELKARRALEAGEGAPITHIRTPGRPLDPNRPVDISIDVEA